MDFLTDSLELIGQPAGLLEWPSMQFVAANAAAEGLNGRVPLDEDAPDLLGMVGLDTDTVVRHIEGRGYYASESRVGLLFLTKLPAESQWSRPDLVLATAHPDEERENAYMSHHRMISMVNANEMGYRALAAMETMAIQLSSAVSAQREMLKTLNHRAAEGFRLQTNVPVMRA